MLTQCIELFINPLTTILYRNWISVINFNHINELQGTPLQALHANPSPTITLKGEDLKFSYKSLSYSLFVLNTHNSGFKVHLYIFNQNTYLNVNASLSFGIVAILFIVVWFLMLYFILINIQYNVHTAIQQTIINK